MAFVKDEFALRFRKDPQLQSAVVTDKKRVVLLYLERPAIRDKLRPGANSRFDFDVAKHHERCGISFIWAPCPDPGSWPSVDCPDYQTGWRWEVSPSRHLVLTRPHSPSACTSHVRDHDSRCRAAPNCCRRADCYCGRGPCGER